MDWVYLDSNATTQPAPEVVEAVDELNKQLWANPSSVHRFGQAVRQRVELARASVARLIRTRPRQIIFTSGGTESDNLAVRGVLDHTLTDVAGGIEAPGVLITTPIEHPAVQEPAEAFEKAGGVVVRVPVDRDGRVDPVQVEDAINQWAGRNDGALADQQDAAGATTDQGRLILVSIQWANNETGVLQPMSELARCVQRVREEARGADRRLRLFLHTDATQAVGKIDVDVQAVGVDLLTLSGHKFHGPKGEGALCIRSGVPARPQLLGGPQEREKRGGTENTTGIVGLGVAAELAQAFLADPSKVAELASLRGRFEEAILRAVPDAVVNSVGAERLWNTSNIGFPGLEAEAILIGLSERGVCASAGAACSSGSLEPSSVLLAMSVPEAVAHGSVRFSFSRFTTIRDIEQAIGVVPEVISRLRQTMPVG